MLGWLRRLRGAFFIFLFLAAFFYVSSLNFRSPERMDLLQRFVVETVGPVLKAFGNLSGLIENAVSEYIWLRNVREENQGLQQRVSGLEKKLIEYQEAYIENLRLRRLLDFRSTIQGEAVAAQVVVHDMTGWFQTLIVDKGFGVGFGRDMPVVMVEGVIGLIVDVS